MKVLVLSYFDNVLGPRVFLKAPKAIKDAELEIIPSLMDLNEKGFFIHITEKVKSANLLFTLPSEYARGKKEILLISIITDIGNEINLNLSQELLQGFAKQLKGLEDGYKAFYNNSSKYEFDGEKLNEIENIFYTFYNSFKSAIKALKEAELRYKTLFEKARDAIIIVDYKTEEILDMNNQAERILGMNRSKAKGQKASILHFAHDYEEIKNTIINMVKMESSPLLETYVKNSKEKAIPIEYNPSEIRIGNQRLIQVIFRDISERKESEERLKMKEKELFNENKKLNALFGISKLAENTYLSLDELFEVALKLIQGAFQYPEKAEIKISFMDKEYITNNFKTSPKIISSLIDVEGVSLLLEATYLNSTNFSDEENYLLYDISNRLKQILINRKIALDRKKMQLELIESEKKYRTIVENFKKITKKFYEIVVRLLD